MRVIDANDFGNRMYHEVFEKDSEDQKWDSGCWIRYKLFERVLASQPVIDSTLHGYRIEHLALIARLLEKGNISPKKVAEVLIDIGRIVDIVNDEFSELLRKSCTLTIE